MVNMKMPAPKADAVTALETYPGKDQPRYPWGLNITLDEDSLAKLSIKGLPKAGAEMTLEAKVTVTNTSSTETQGGGERRSLSLQITDMALEGGGKKKSAEEVLYSKKD